MVVESIPIQRPVVVTAAVVDHLAETFNQEGVVYCHWKSNLHLAQAAAGRTDLDLLVDRRSLQQAQTILARLGYKAAIVRWGDDSPSIRHYYGLDPDTLQLVHVHLFSRVLTGESYVKGHLFPCEEMLLQDGYYFGQIRVASKPAELVLFTLRMFIKYGSLLDLVSLWRQAGSVRAEVQWLQEGDDLSQELALLKTYCPVIEEPLFLKCVATLNSNASLPSRMLLAGQVRRRLKVYAKYTPTTRLLAYARMLRTEVWRRLAGKRRNKVLQAGGSVIAFVGADATGKSTLVAETARWLGSTFAVKTIHTGKPPSSWLTAPANLLLALARRLTSRRGDSLDSQQSSTNDLKPSRHQFKGLSSLPYALRAVTLAWDRQRLILKTRRLAAEGEIVICDRYPSQVIGAMDSPRLEEAQSQSGQVAAIYNRLARLEKRLYAQIPPPDIVLRLRVSLETAKQRNRERHGQEGERYLEARHRQSQDWHMPGTRHVYDIDTEQSLEETIRSVKEAIWEVL